tara:strand:- start:2788 stop:4467 length:1680 start_codon:yes stop_codon:yes gene_type:complete
MAMSSLLKVQAKNRRLVNFEPNACQQRIYKTIFEQQEAGRPVRILELKGRQQGSSTGIGAYCFMRTICESNTNALIITEEKSGSANNIFQMYKRFLNNLPFELELERTREGQLLKFPEPLGSQLKVEGEKNITSFTFQLVHLSEAAFFSNLKSTLAMLYQTVPDDPSTCIILETTANAAGDDFATEWQRAIDEQSDFTALFIPYFVMAEYAKPFDDEGQKEQFLDHIMNGGDNRYGDERKVYETYQAEGMTLENMNWRRNAIRNRCQGSLHEFNRQYPQSWEEAFQTSGNNVFDLGVITTWLKEVKDPPMKGAFNKGIHGVEFKESHDGIVNIWEPPDVAKEYVIGSDHAEGLDAGDFSAAVVYDRLPLREVARLRGFDGRQVTTDEFTEQMFYLARHYNRAWVCPENNADGGTVCLLLQMEYRYPNMVSERMLGISSTNRVGWRNTVSTRRRGVARLQEAIRDEEILTWDEKFLREALWFVGVNGRPQAQKKGRQRRAGESEDGHYDDLIFATVGALFAHDALPVPKTSRLIQQAREVERGLPTYDIDLMKDAWLDYV